MFWGTIGVVIAGVLFYAWRRDRRGSGRTHVDRTASAEAETSQAEGYNQAQLNRGAPGRTIWGP